MPCSRWRSGVCTLAVGLVLACALPAQAAAQASVQTPAQADHASTIADLQQQIDELRALVEELRGARPTAADASPDARQRPSAPAPVGVQVAEPAVLAGAGAGPGAEAGAGAGAGAGAEPALARAPAGKAWYERLQLRGYTQMRLNEIVAGDAVAPPGQSRLRSVGDGAITDRNNFSFRRIRLILQGDLNDHVSLYLQPDFATSVSNQAAGERRDAYGQIRDAYADVFPLGDRKLRIRLGQSKVPFGWENLQSSSNRLALDRTDGINSAVPNERDLGIVAYFTPEKVQRIWRRLEADQHKLFGNYGAFGLGVYNGQGTNRVETNNDLMTVAMATWPFELDGLGLDGQVLEVGGAVIRNRFNPELRSGGTSPVAFADNRVGFHAIVYPQPIGLQAEWNWGTGPEFDPVTQTIQERPLVGGYVQAMARVRQSPVGPFYPFARWQHYRGGFKAALNAPRLETDELELGLEFLPTPPLEITVTYGWARRREPDERRLGRAEGELLRVQAQWNY